MQPIKYVWAIRALVYKAFFGHVGNLSYIGKPCFIEGRKNIRIGNKTRIFPGVRLQAIGCGSIEIGDNVAMGQCVHIVSQDSKLVIGSNCAISQYSIISNVDHVIDNIDKSVMDSGYIIKETKIGDGCFVGHCAVISPGTILGKHCIVGANAVVKGIFPDYCIIAGVPGRIIKRFNLETHQWEKVDSNAYFVEKR